MTVTDAPSDTRLNDAELRAWRGFADASLLLIGLLDRQLKQGHGIAHSDYGVLFHLRDAPDNRMRMTALAEQTCYSKSRLSHQVSKLERAGLVSRHQCPSDNRGVWVALTPTGKQIIEAATPDHRQDVREHFLEHLTDQQIVAVGEAFESVLNHIRKVPGCADGAE